MHRDQRRHRLRLHSRATAVAASAALLGGMLSVAGMATASQASTLSSDGVNGPVPTEASCHMGNGVTHVIRIGFDNVHFFRDNPNVPSDLEMMPNLLHFFENNGTFLSNSHTPLIAHTADDLLTTATGLYGDRQGMPISNSYQAYNTDGSTDPAGSFAYWTDPVFDTAANPNPGHDTNPSMVFSPTPPATTSPAPAPNRVTPAPWVPYTRAGCDVGDVATANEVLENTGVDIPKVFGAGSPEDQQLQADKDSFKDAETSDYVGLGVHCAQGSTLCSSATGVKFGQTQPSPTAVTDSLPDEPGGYNGFQALFGHRYVAPQIGAGQANLSHNGFQVTNGSGNLVDENGNQINGAFTNGQPGFPGFGPINASQTLAYMADMLESGVPVVNGYIADIHGNEAPAGLTACKNAPAALGSGDPCYVAQAQYYNDAFGTFFKRLAADGITPQNTLFVLSSDEGDHEAGANVGRAVQPTPANCDGATVSGDTVTPDVPCTYPAGKFGELAGNINQILAAETHDTTPFSLEADSAPEFYVTGNPGENDAKVRTLERDLGKVTGNNPYTGTTQPIANYLATPSAMALVHMVNADPARTPTVAMFARPDYFLSTGTATCTGPADCITVNPKFAYNHGDYAAEIDTNYIGLAGPGVKHLGLDGSGPTEGPNSAGPDSGQITVPNEHTKGTWADETDIRPTTLYLAGLKDDYEHDGRVITEVLTNPNHALAQPGVAALGACYKQLNSSVGELGTDVLIASTKAAESSTPNDTKFKLAQVALRSLDKLRDKVALPIKGDLEAAAFGNQAIRNAGAELGLCQGVISVAKHLAAVG